MIRIGCTFCGATYTLDDAFFGKAVACQRCGAKFIINDKLLLDASAAPPAPQLELEPVAEPLPAPEPSTPRLPPPPRRSRSRGQKHGVGGQALVIGLTIVLVGAIVLGCLYYLARTLNEEDDAKNRRGLEAAATFSRPTRPAMGVNLPTVDASVTANFVIDKLDSESLGLTALRVQNPRFAVVPRPPADAEAPSELVKRSSALIRVEREDGNGTGSGFFALEPGLMVTNAHVVGMLKPRDDVPKRIEVVINANQEKETRITDVRVVAVDRRHDLAILRVKHPNLPPPLQIVSSTGLTEAQRLYVAGFPHANSLGTDITVSTSSVSSLRKEAGELVKVQTQGGMNPGNSGGPVVDALGRVVGVSVAVFGGTQINFAVPTDFILDLHRGAARRLLVYPPCRQADGNVRLPVAARFDDGSLRIGKVALEWWIGEPGESRPAAAEPPAPKPGDTPRQVVELNYTRSGFLGAARGELTLPPLPEGKAYWLQLTATDAKDQTKRWFTAHAHQPKDALEAKAAAVGKPTGTSAGETALLYRGTFRIRGERGEHGFSPLRLNVRDVWEEPEAGAARKIKAFSVGLRANDESFPLFQLMQVAQVAGQQANPAGDNTTDVTSLKEYERFLHGAMGGLIQSIPADMALTMPEAKLEPLKTSWTQPSKLLIPFAFGNAIIPKMNLKCAYLGMQKVGGRELAVVRLESAILQSQESPAYGALWGIARIDLKTGAVADCYCWLDVEIEEAPVAPMLKSNFGEETSLLGAMELRWQTKPKSSASAGE